MGFLRREAGLSLLRNSVTQEELRVEPGIWAREKEDLCSDWDLALEK